MQARRRLVAVLGSLAVLAGLTACERPAPLVTLYSGQTSLYDHAFLYCFEGQDPGKEPRTRGACRYPEEGRTQKVLQVEPGDQVLVDVDRELADTGWFVTLRRTGSQAQPQQAQPPQPPLIGIQTEHVARFRFQPDEAMPTWLIEVRKLERPEEGARQTGLWQFVLVPR